jgi:ribose transport system substrate-binding protein
MIARRLWLATLAVAAAALAACGPQEADKAAAPPPPKPDAKLTPINPAAAPAAGGKAVLFISNAKSPFWDSVKTGIDAGSKEQGVEGRLQLNDGTVEGQIKLLEEALAKKDEYLGVAISAIRPDAEGLLSALRKLKEAGLPVVTVDSDCTADARLAFIGTNNAAAGELLGKKAAELIPGGAKFCAFVGEPGAQNAKDRIEGFKKGAGEKFQSLEVYKDDADTGKARSNVETAITSHADATMMLGIWSYNGPTIGEVVQKAGKLDKIKVITFDAEPNLLPLIENGTVAATCAQNPYEFGRLGMKLLVAYAHKDQKTIDELLNGSKDIVDVPVQIVTKDTYPAFKADLDKKGLKGS